LFIDYTDWLYWWLDDIGLMFNLFYFMIAYDNKHKTENDFCISVYKYWKDRIEMDLKKYYYILYRQMVGYILFLLLQL